VLKAGLNDLLCQSLSDFRGLGDAAAFRDKAWHIGTGRYMTVFSQGFDVETDSCFVDFNDFSLASRRGDSFGFHAEAHS
jgi:hypothetical protein